MTSFRGRRPFKRNLADRQFKDQGHDNLISQGSTGAEAEYLKSLVDSRTRVTVVLKTGEQLRGRIRYYDRDCFSFGPDAGGPRLFLRKSSVHSIRED